MNIVAVTRFKHGELFKALAKLGWTQSDLARQVGVNASSISAISTMRSRPSRELADKIMNVFGDNGIGIDPLEGWPEKFTTKKSTIITYADVTPEHMLRLSGQKPQIEYIEQIDRKRVIGQALSNLNPREEQVVRSYYYDKKTLDEIADDLGVSRTRVAQIIGKAITRLRHPRNKNILKEVL